MRSDLPALSRVCHDNTGRPNRTHAACANCGCPCHEVPAPNGFRDLVKAYARKDTP